MKIAKWLTVSLTLAIAGLSGSMAFAATEIQFWHSMTGPLSEKLTEITEEFNAKQHDYKIILVNKGNYAEAMTAAIAAFRAKGQPDILQVHEVGTGTFMAAGQAIYPVDKLMKDEGKAFNASDFLPAVTGYYSSTDGKMLAFPFNSSTLDTFYNLDAFKKAGLSTENLPKTWDEVADAARKIVQTGAAKCGLTTTWPSWVHVENFSAWHNIPISTKENGFGGLDAVFEIDNPLVKRHWSNLVKWQKEGIFTYGGRASTAMNSFLSGQCAIMVSSSSSIADIKSSGHFSLGVGMMPYYADVKGAPQNSIIGGAALWVLSGKPKVHYKGIAEYFEFLSSPKIQAEWSEATGYLPITTAAYELSKSEGFFTKNPGSEIAIQSVNLHTPTVNSKGLRFGNFSQIRTMFEEELEYALNGTKTVDQALSDAQRRGNTELRKFEAQQSK